MERNLAVQSRKAHQIPLPNVLNLEASPTPCPSCWDWVGRGPRVPHRAGSLDRRGGWPGGGGTCGHPKRALDPLPSLWGTPGTDAGRWWGWPGAPARQDPSLEPWAGRGRSQAALPGAGSQRWGCTEQNRVRGGPGRGAPRGRALRGGGRGSETGLPRVVHASVAPPGLGHLARLHFGL